MRTLDQRLRQRPHRPCLHADRRARRRQDHHRAHHRPRAELHRPRRQASGPTIEPCGVCEHCDRHRRGRAMSTSWRWTPPPAPASTTSARSSRACATRRSRRATRSTSSTKCTCCRTQAFNALLKTLEEPPPHVKFIFATTEIRKVPVTVLSRCQRFDLRRVEVAVLIGHFAEHRRGREGRGRAEAPALIARAAEGSVRDAPVAARPGDRAGRRRGRGRRQCATCWAWPTAAGCSTCSSTCSCAARPPRRSRMLDELYGAGADPVVVMQDLARSHASG